MLNNVKFVALWFGPWGVTKFNFIVMFIDLSPFYYGAMMIY